MKLKDKVAIITGGTRGIGRAISERFLSEGARVIVIGTSQNSVNTGLEYLRSKGYDNVDGYPLNIGSSAAVAKIFKEIVAKYPTIDVLVNNAGITRDGLSMRMKESDWDSVLEVNLKGAFNCIQGVIRPMMKQRNGSIINISSVVGLTGNIGQANYSASKAGLIGLTKSLAKELATRNITVNAVAPGYITTEMTDEMTDESKNFFMQNIPLARAGSTDEVSSLVVFLASNESRYITGQTLNIDGGLVMN